MTNWLTKIFNNVNPPLAISQGDTSIHAIPTEKEETTWEEAKVVSSSSRIPLESEEPLPDSKEKETQILFEAFKKLTPEYFLVIAEMRNLLNSPVQKIVFHALSTGLSSEQVAIHLGITQDEVSTIYQEAIVEIQIQSGFVRRYLDAGVLKENTSVSKVKKQKSDSHPQEEEEATKKALLSEPLHKCLNLETRTLTIFRNVSLYTLEDLLRFASTKGIEALIHQNGFGRLSLNKLTDELIQKGIFKPDGSCELYKYMPRINKKDR